MESKMSSDASPDKRMRFEVAMAEVAQSQLRASRIERYLCSPRAGSPLIQNVEISAKILHRKT